MKKFLSLLLVLAMVFSLAACSSGENPENSTPVNSGSPSNSDNPSDPGGEDEPYVGLDWAAIDGMDHDEASEAIYDFVLGEFADYYATAKKASGDERMALMAIAEAKLLESGVFLPIYTQGGNYAMSRVVPRSNAATTLWGLDEYRYHTLLVTNELIKAADRTELLSMWSEAADANEYRANAKAFLEGKGYTFSDTYTVADTLTVNIWDTIATSYTSDSQFISGTYDNLLEYDAKGIQHPALAESYDVSADGTVYTFHIRQGVQWVDQQGSPIGQEVTADDWVASMEHLLDNVDALGYLLTSTDGCGIKGFDAFLKGDITDFNEIGVKAIDKYTLEYTLEAPFAPFPTMLGYACFAPLNRSFYEARGGTFGAAEGKAYTPGTFGQTPADIAYCGPYLIKNYTDQNTLRYEANPTYWNADTVLLPNLVYTHNDGSDTLRAYREARDGVTSGCGFNASALELAKTEIPEGETETYFNLYAYVSSGTGTTYVGWWNVNRGVWTNYDDPSQGVSPKSDDEIARFREAITNNHFRMAVNMAFDQGSYNAQSVGEDLKYARLRNSYTPGTFGFLAGSVTVDINGTPTTFPANTSFGEIEQAQLDADGIPLKVWDPNGDNGAGSGDGFDGWYNPTAAVAELEKAIAELAQVGVEVSAAHPIYIDYPEQSWSEVGTRMSNTLKQSIENTLGGAVIINIINFPDTTTYQGATYRFSYGNEANFDLSTGSGWGPDYGDAQSYLDTIQAYGYMCKNLGLF